jgi:hypothetical protein
MLYRLTRRLADWLDDLIQSHPNLSATAVLSLATAAFSAIAWRSLMWTDELYTYYIAIQPTARQLIQAVREGCDGAPPLYALIARSLLGVFPNHPAFALRLPSALGGILMAACVFALARRVVSPVYAIAAMLAALVSSSAIALDARPYGLMLGCAGVALLAWQAASEGRNRAWALPAMALSLTTGIALQYYAVFLLAPLGCGEIVRWWKSRKLDFWVLAILAASPLVLIPHFGLIQAGMKFVTYFWSKASWPQAVRVEWAFARPAVTGLVVALAANYVWTLWSRTSSTRQAPNPNPTPPPLHEICACGVLALLPVLIVAAAMLTTHTFTDRYACPALIGLNLVLIVLAARRTGESKMLGVCLVVVFFAQFAAGNGRLALEPAQLREGEAVRRMLDSVPAKPLPIVISDSHAFFELWYYSPELRPRLVYPLDLELERRYKDNDTDVLIFSALRHRTSHRIPDYESFIKTTPAFLLCAVSTDWIKWEMLRSGLRLNPLVRSGAGADALELYEVTHQPAFGR